MHTVTYLVCRGKLKLVCAKYNQCTVLGVLQQITIVSTKAHMTRVGLNFNSAKRNHKDIHEQLLSSLTSCSLHT